MTTKGFQDAGDSRYVAELRGGVANVKSVMSQTLEHHEINFDQKSVHLDAECVENALERSLTIPAEHYYRRAFLSEPQLIEQQGWYANQEHWD